MSSGSEQSSNNPERYSGSPEKGVEFTESSSEKLEQLKNEFEKSPELSIEDLETKTEKARVEAKKMAVSVENGGKKAEKEEKPASSIRRGSISTAQKNDSYKRTMKRVQSELPISERMFSIVIHNKTIEKTSEVIGNSFARPNSILYGAFAAFIITLITYSVARFIGYQLSGSETIIAFCIGWLVGLIIDYIRTLVSGKK